MALRIVRASRARINLHRRSPCIQFSRFCGNTVFNAVVQTGDPGGFVMKNFLSASLAVAALALPATASAVPFITVNYTTTTAGLPTSNNYNAQLSGLGITKLAYGAGTSLFLTGPARVTFEFLGSESAFSDTYFSLLSGALSLKETSFQENHFLSPVVIGSQDYPAVGPLNLAGILKFEANKLSDDSFIGGATVGDNGFGVYLTPSMTSGSTVTSLIFGFDDQITNPDDDDWDDFIVRATISAIPEPSTWALMIVGFGLIGAGMRRTRQKVAVSYA